MSLAQYCNVNSFVLTESSKDLIARINNKRDLGNSLAFAASAHVIVNVFANPSSAKVVDKIHNYEWEEFGKAMGAINDITKNQIYNLVEDHLFMSYDNMDFWKCVREAVR